MSARYTSLGDLKARLQITDTTDDIMLGAVIEAASRAIDDITGRRFYASTETRYFTAVSSLRCYVDDLLSITTLKTDDDNDGTLENTWESTDYILMPVNASANGWPYQWLDVAAWGTEYFPVTSNPQAIQIIGSFGYCTSTPSQIEEACLLMAAQIFARKDATYGVVGPAGFYQRIKHQAMEDPITMMLLSPYCRMT